MRFDPGAPDKFAVLFGARYPRKKKLSASQGNKKKSQKIYEPKPGDDVDVAPGTRLHKTARERQLEELERDRRLFKRYQASRQSRLDRLTQEVPGVAKFLKALARIGPKANAIAYRDIDFDLADLARRHSLSSVPRDYDRFTLYEEAVVLVQRVAKRQRRHTEPDAADFFCQGSMTTLDELKQELRLR